MVLSVLAMVIYTRADADFTLPSKVVVKASQLDVVLKSEQSETMVTTFGTLKLDREGLYPVPFRGRHIIYISQKYKLLQSRLMVYIFMRSWHHCETAETLQALRPYRVWGSIEAGVVECIKHCFHCMDDKAKTLKPRLFGEVVHGTVVGEMIKFDFFHIEAGGGRWRTRRGDEISEGPLVLMGAVSGCR